MSLHNNILNDTNPITDHLLIEMFKELTIKQRLSKTLSFSSSIINLSKRAISRANPDKSKAELDLIFVKLHYGNELAEKLKLFLQNLQNE